MQNNLQSLNEFQFLLVDEVKAEYEKGLLALNSLPSHTVTFYGGSRVKPETETYTTVFKLAKIFSDKGWGVVSGGGPGVMAASLEGAKLGSCGQAVAFRIDLNNEKPTVQAQVDILFKHFSVRKYMLRQSDVFVFAPGGIGTLDELMENLTLMATNKHPKKPIFLLDSKFWQGYLNWFEEVLYKQRGVIDKSIFDILITVDTPEEVINYLDDMSIQQL